MRCVARVAQTVTNAVGARCAARAGRTTMIDDPPPDDATPGRLSRPVTIRALLLALALTALVSIAAGVVGSSTLLERGPAGAPGGGGPPRAPGAAAGGGG